MADLSGRRVGDYILRSKIGDGGHGDVYRAEHRLLRRVAVVKVMNQERQCSDNAAALFLREAQLASQLRHPNAAHVYDFGVADGDGDDGLMWIAMELIEGITLEDWLETHGPMSLAEAVQFFEPLAHVVDAVHRCGIVHRDLKPSNVMVVEGTALDAPGALIPILIDFGIAKGKPARLVEDDEPIEVPPGDDKDTGLIRAAPAPRRREPTYRVAPPPRVRTHERRITPTGCGFGSRLYASPEQWLNASSVGPAADIYSLGVMLYEALSGQLPFTATSTDELIQQHHHVDPDLSYFSSDVDRILYRALSKVPEHRHANALELAAELRAALKADPNEQIRALTRRWHERGRSSDLLARGATLAELKRSVQSPRVAMNLSVTDDSFITLSLQRARRAKWGLTALVALVVVSVLLVRAKVQNHMDEQLATAAEVEQGRQALRHGQSAEAVRHLEDGYERGDRSPGLKFMLARALQPRLAELARFTSTSGRMWSAVFAPPGGKRVLTTDDKSAQMWDAASGQRLFTMSHGDTVYAAVFSPDESRIITAGGDGTVRIWNAATGAQVRELRHHGAGTKRWPYAAVAMSSNLVAATDTMGRVVHVWDATTGEQVADLANDGPGIYLVAFSADGSWLASSGRDEVRVFDTSSWQQVAAIASPRVRSLAFDPTGPRLAVGTYDGAASIWEIPGGTRLRSLRDGGASVDAVTFARDGVLVAAAGRDGIVQVWNTSLRR